MHVREVGKNTLKETRTMKCKMLGVNVSTLSMKDTVDFLVKNISQLSGRYICVANVHTTVMSYDDDRYRHIQNHATLVLPDGSPLSVIARRRGHAQAERVTGPDLMGEIFEVTKQRGYSHYFYGSKTETLELLKEQLELKYPGICIAGMYSPPFRNLTQEEDDEITTNINSCKPDFVWVGLGAPKQEIWMSQHEGRVSGLMIGVGAGFDYYAGNLKRAPKWMQRYSLEWLYRLMQEPRRLLKRYVYTNIKFLWLIAKEGKH